MRFRPRVALRRPLLCLWFLASASISSFAGPINILLVTLDTTRADRMGFLGSKLGLTPNLDALAKRSEIFTRAYSHVPLTTPSHASILTGTYPQFNQVSDLGTPLGKDLPYVPELLSRQGYRTAAFVGAQILDPKSVLAPGFDRGFATYDAEFHSRGPKEDRYRSVERRGAVVADHALAWLNRHAQQPFFLWVHFYDPHDPYDPPPPFRARYAGSPYDGEIAYTDSAVGRLLSGLQSTGVYDRTLIVVVADHGEAFGEHGEQSHGLFLYDETLHVPLLMKAPGARAAAKRIVESRVGLVDIAPTMLQAAGVAVPKAMQGKSLAELIKASAGVAARSASPSPDRPVYAETTYPHRAFGWSSLRAWRTSKYLYIDAPKRELYDQVADPGATRNLAASAPAVADTMAAQLEAFRNQTSGAGAAPAAITPRQAAQLQALGYVSSGAVKPEAPGQERGADPKENVQISNLLHQALLEADEENYREAIPRLEQVLKAQPNIALANLQLGRAWNALEDYMQALPWLQKAVELTPQSVEAHYELAAAMGGSGDWPGAAKQLQAAVAEDPNSDELQFQLGSADEEMGHIPDAMKQYRAALRINPDHYRANLLLGRLLAIQQQFKDALPYLRKAVKLQPDSADAHKMLGNAYTGLGDEARARREQAEAQRLQITTPP
jgi:choline-sulfatase